MHWYRTSQPFEKRHIQLMGNIRPAVIRWAVQVGSVLSLDITLTSGGASPPALTLFGGVRFIIRCLRPSFEGNADGVRGTFGNAGCVWAPA